MLYVISYPIHKKMQASAPPAPTPGKGFYVSSRIPSNSVSK